MLLHARRVEDFVVEVVARVGRMRENLFDDTNVAGTAELNL